MDRIPTTRAVGCRRSLLDTLRQSAEWDVVVIGGGATGLGAAVDAAARGFRTLLLEGADFAKGTSSRSTKLVHGGVRYLEQGNIHLVREALRERGLLRQNAPHLVHDLRFVIPAYAWWSKPFYGAGVCLYDLLAGSRSFGACRILNTQEALQRAPNLITTGLRGGVLYHDGQFDDARLATTLVQTLLDRGGIALNYVAVTGVLKEGGKISGVTARDGETGEEFSPRAKAVINATGVFVDAVRRMDEPGVASMLSPSQGAHLVVDRRFQPGDSAVLIPKTEDGRVLFAIPWHGKVLLGTTDTPVNAVSLEPRALEEEIDFILRTAGRYLANRPSRGDVLAVFAGQRPLVTPEKTRRSGGTASVSREHTIRVSASGLTTITGGKWTTYRLMGENAVTAAARVAGLAARPSVTRDLRLHGWSAGPSRGPSGGYGSDLDGIRRLPGAETKVHDAFDLTEAEVRWAARFEMARSVEDVLARRCRALFLDARSSVAAAPRVAAILAEELERDDGWARAQIASYEQLSAGYVLE